MLAAAVALEAVAFLEAALVLGVDVLAAGEAVEAGDVQAEGVEAVDVRAALACEGIGDVRAVEAPSCSRWPSRRWTRPPLSPARGSSRTNHLSTS